MKFTISPETRKKLRDWAVEQLKGAFIKAALKTVLGTAAAGGFKGWLVKFIATELYEEVGEPVARAVLIEAGYRLDRYDGKLAVKKLREAGNADSYDDAADDILS